MSYTFKENKYTKWYYSIIHNARQRHLTVNKDRHHIIPRCLGGTNDPDNLVNLTYREHFIVHLLLIRMVDDKNVYKLVHAIIRFTKKVKNSKQYNLLRRYLSTYSKGVYNKSYNKVWARDKVSGEVIYIDKNDFDESLHIKGLGKQRGGFSGYIHINDGIQQRMIPAEQEIPQGWNRGRLLSVTNDHMKLMAKNRHTLDKDKAHSKKLKGQNHFNYGKPAFTKGRKWVNNGSVSKMVNPTELESYLSNGWISGRL